MTATGTTTSRRAVPRWQSRLSVIAATRVSAIRLHYASPRCLATLATRSLTRRAYRQVASSGL